MTKMVLATRTMSLECKNNVLHYAHTLTGSGTITAYKDTSKLHGLEKCVDYKVVSLGIPRAYPLHDGDVDAKDEDDLTRRDDGKLLDLIAAAQTWNVDDSAPPPAKFLDS